MINIIETAKENIRIVGTPILPDSIKEYFLNKDLLFVVDYNVSRLKGLPLLTYMSNLNIPIDVSLEGEDIIKHYHEIMPAYMTQRMICSAPTLNMYCAQLLLLAKGMPYKDIPYKTDIPEEEIYTLLVNNHEIIFKWMRFLDSIPVFMTAKIKALNDKFKPEESVEVIVDKEFIGHNLMNLFSLPMFGEVYLTLTKINQEPAYFKHQYEDRMFANKFMIEYVDNDISLLPGIYEHVAMNIDNLDSLEMTENAIFEKIKTCKELKQTT